MYDLRFIQNRLIVIIIITTMNNDNKIMVLICANAILVNTPTHKQTFLAGCVIPLPF